MMSAMDDRDTEDNEEERALARMRARKAGIILGKVYLFGAAVTFLILLLTSSHGLGPLLVKTLTWPRTLGNIALSL